MKLILANNQGSKFVGFYDEIKKDSDVPIEYAGYESLIFKFNFSNEQTIDVINLKSKKSLRDYDGVYINGYLNTYELAAAVAIACQSNDVGYVNKEFEAPPSLSKLTMYAKLAKYQIKFPKSLGGTKSAFSAAGEILGQIKYPAVLKRADADRGIDNYKVNSSSEVQDLIKDQSKRSLWILQEFITHNGYYLLNFYDSQPKFGIYRTLEKRPDNNHQKAHMYKPKGGTNAKLQKISEVPEKVVSESKKAVYAMNRQIASVDSLISSADGEVYVIEVNYNPQLVTIETFKNERTKAFIDNLKNIT